MTVLKALCGTLNSGSPQAGLASLCLNFVYVANDADDNKEVT